MDSKMVDTEQGGVNTTDNKKDVDIAVQGDEYVQHYDEGSTTQRRSHICCGCCCDTRKAVNVVNIVNMILLILALVGMSVLASGNLAEQVGWTVPFFLCSRRWEGILTFF